MKYVIEKDFHRGNGGYMQYNRYWTTRTFDDSIMSDLSITPEFADDVRQELSTKRAERTALMMAERAKADARFLAKYNSDIIEESCHDQVNTSKGLGTVETVFLIASGLSMLGYGVYRVTPKVRKWWSNRKSKKEQSDKKSA